MSVQPDRDLDPPVALVTGATPSLPDQCSRLELHQIEPKSWGAPLCSIVPPRPRR